MKTRAPFLVCEDGLEYGDRFVRTLGGFSFVRSADFADALARIRAGRYAGLLMDLDFRRTPVDRLVDEAGQTRPSRPEDERRRLSSSQGILILRALRALGITLPALLFADLDDQQQIAFLQSSLAPLVVIPSTASLAATSARLSALAERLRD